MIIYAIQDHTQNIIIENVIGKTKKQLKVGQTYLLKVKMFDIFLKKYRTQKKLCFICKIDKGIIYVNVVSGGQNV